MTDANNNHTKVKFIVHKIASYFSDDRRIRFPVAFLLTFGCYALRPNISTPDALGMALQVEKGGLDLYQHHHLLYNVFVGIFYKCLSFFGFTYSILDAGILMNAFLLGAMFLLSAGIMKNAHWPKPYFMSLLVYSCFCTLRFGAENETYMLPLFFCVLSIFIYSKYLKNNSEYLFWIFGFLLAFSSLIHQIHILFFLGVIVGFLLHKEFVKAFKLLLMGLVIPSIYIFVYLYEFNYAFSFEGIWNFVTHDYHQGTADASFPNDFWYMLPIGMVRSVVQIHGIQSALFQENFVWLFPLVPFLVYLFFFLKWLTTHRIHTQKLHPNPYSFLKWPLFLHLLFAGFSHGNPEFMVMMPFLIVFSFPNVAWKFLMPHSGLLSLALLCWNSVFGLYAFHRLDNEGIKFLAIWAEKNPQKHIILQNYPAVTNWAEYKKIAIQNVHPSPGQWASKIGEQNAIHLLDSIIMHFPVVVTDAFNAPVFFNKAAFRFQHINQNYFRKFLFEKLDSFEVLNGIHYLWKVKPKLAIEKR